MHSLIQVTNLADSKHSNFLLTSIIDHFSNTKSLILPLMAQWEGCLAIGQITGNGNGVTNLAAHFGEVGRKHPMPVPVFRLYRSLSYTDNVKMKLKV
jgi:hypothetical protein